jgi:CDP-glycerol glycerophosphotransferase (TagB/SpsB family)
MKFSLGNEWNDLKKFENLSLDERSIVFYSENENSKLIFESLIDELTTVHNMDICYVTSSKSELSFMKSKNRVKTFYIGDGMVRTKFFLNLKAKIMIMTMPDLETFHIKRSKVYSVHYVYMFHAMLSTHLVYQKGAFDHYDTIFCVSDFQIKEIKSAEEIYDLKPKRLVKFGYTHLDNLLEKYANHNNSLSTKKDPLQVLLAPGWGKNGIFEESIEELIDVLLNASFTVILRPHPMTQKKSKKKISNLEKKFSSNPNFILEQDITNFDSFSQSDIMISDWSGVALEFAFTFEKPVLYVDTPKKMHNPEFEKIPYVPIEESIRNKIGMIVPQSDIESIPKRIEKLCFESELMKEQINKIRDETIFNIGKSSKIGASTIMEILNELKDKHSMDKSN